MEKTNQPGVYLRGGVGLPTVAPRSTNKVRESVEKASNSSSSPIGVAFNQNINKSSPDKDNFRFKRQISGSSNDMAVSVEDEFSRKDSFRFPSGGNITNVSNRNLSQARFSNSHRKSRTKTEQVSVQVSATGRMNYPTRANPNGGKRRLNNNKSGRNSNTSSNSSIGNNDQQQLYDYSSNSIVNTNNMNNNNFNQGNYYNNNNNNTNNDDTNNNSNSGNMYNNRNNNNNNNMRRPHKNHGYAKEKSRRRRRHSSNSDRPHGNNKNYIRGKVASTSKHNSMDSMHESRMKAIFKKKNQNGNYKTPRKDDNNNNNNNIGNGMYYGNNSNSKEKINISPSSTERIINEHGQIRITNTPSPPPSANPNSDRKRPSRRPGSNLINNNHPSSSKSKSKIKVPDTMKNMTIETRKVIHDEYYSKNINNNKTSLVSIHKGGSSNSSSSSGKHSSGRKRNKRNSSGNNKFTSGSPPVINDKNKNAQSKGYGLTYKERHSPTKRSNQRRDNNTPNKGGLQNPRLSNIHNNDNSRKKTFSPSAPNRPRNTNGGSGHKSRPRHQKRHSQRRQMQQQQQQQMEDQEYGAGNDNVDEDGDDDDDDDEVIQPRENPNLRLQSIDDIQSTNNINKSPRNNVKNSKRKIGTPPGAAIFQFPLWNNNKKTNAISISNPKEDGLRQGSSTTASTNSTSNVMTPPSLVKGSIHEDKDAVEWKNPSPPDSKKQTPSKRTSFFSSFFKKTDKDSDSPPSTKKETKRPSSSSAATTLINIDEKSMSKNILTTKTINSPRNKKSNANGDGRIVPRLQRNENSKSAPGLQDSLNSNEGLESFNTSNNNANVVITNSKKKKKKEKTISPPVVSGEVIHEFGLWKNVKKNVDKADKALDSYKKNMDNDGTTTSKKSSKKDKNRNKNSSSIIGKKLPTPPKKPSSSGKRFRGRNGRKSPSTSPVEKAKVKESTSSYSNDYNNITNSNISTGQLSIDVGLNANEDDESSIMENIVVNTTNDSSAMTSNSNFSQSPRIAKTGAVLFRQSLSPTPFQWKKGEKIGHGTYGDVFMALNQVTGELFCVKQIRVQPGVVGGEKEAHARIKALEREISVMKNLEHPHIVRYLGTESKDADPNSSDANTAHLTRRVFVFLEYVPGGSLSKMLRQFGAFGEPVVQRYTFQILRGLHYLHSKGFIHRDIKGANVLVSEAGVAKLADFGCSKQLQGAATGSMDESLRSIRGSIPWMAPEVIRQSGHGRSADIWSLGATVIEMLTASRPWPNLDDSFAALFHVASAKTGPPYPDHVSDLCKDFLDCCFPIEPKERLTASQLLEHEFLASVAKKAKFKNNSRSKHLGEGVARSTEF